MNLRQSLALPGLFGVYQERMLLEKADYTA
jgi:hypothetical protein